MFLTRYLTLESYLKVSYSDNFCNNLRYVSYQKYIYDMRVIDIRNFFFLLNCSNIISSCLFLKSKSQYQTLYSYSLFISMQLM